MSLVVGIALASQLGCGTDSVAEDPPVFREDYAATYQEVRNCRWSLEHDLVRIRVLASPDAVTPYTGRGVPFPTGAIIIKEQYDEDDTSCSGPIVDYTVMQKLAEGSSPETLGWTWQKVDADHTTIKTDLERCTRCHTSCGVAPDGYDGTCALP